MLSRCSDTNSRSYPRCTYCKAHSLNLVIIHASRESLISGKWWMLFKRSPLHSTNHLLRFQQILDNDPVGQGEMKRHNTLHCLCDMRWAARANALHPFRCAITTVVSTLEELPINYGDSKAETGRNSILQFEFIITLVEVAHILSGLTAVVA